MDRTSFCVRDTLIGHPPTPRPRAQGPRDQEAAVAADREWGVWGGEAPPPIIYFLFVFLDLNQVGYYLLRHHRSYVL